MNTLDASSNQIAAEYRATKAAQGRAPADKQWTFGAQLKALKLAFYVAKESEQVRTK